MKALMAVMYLGLFVPRLVVDTYANQEQVDDLVARVPRILEIYEKAIQGQDPFRGHLAQPSIITTIDENLSLLQCNSDTMAWLVFAPFFQERETLDRGHVFHIKAGGNILRSYDDCGINATTGIIDEAISRFGVSRMVQRAILLCKTGRSGDRDLMLGTRILVSNLLEDQRFHEQFILRRRVHRILADRFWECTRAMEALKHDAWAEEASELVRVLRRCGSGATT
ncbi:hypothetical protein FRC01_001421 [Tulasnella sp. 417]|nr:hypothetical protein FRC01_001421 [Tulasnella sp. 417]